MLASRPSATSLRILSRRGDDVIERYAFADGPHGVRSVPRAGLGARLIVTPADRRLVGERHERRSVEARIDALILVALIVDDAHKRALRRVAAAGELSFGRARLFRRAQGRVVGDGRGSAHQILVRREAGALIRLEHLVGKRVSFRHDPVGPHLAPGNVRVGSLTARRALLLAGMMRAVGVGEVEPVHIAVCVLDLEPPVGMRDVVRSRHRDGDKRNLPAFRILSRLRGIGPRKTLEEVIDGAVLLNDDHHVTDLGIARPARRRIDGNRRARSATAPGCERGDRRRQ